MKNIEITGTVSKGDLCACCLQKIPDDQRCWRLVVVRVKVGSILGTAASFLSSGPAADERLCLLCADDLRRSLGAPS